MNYLLGDVQGCADALERMLAEIAFSPSRDRLYVLGDLVNRGPSSLATLRRLRGLGDSAVCLLGNHDWHLLAASCGVRRLHRSDTLDDVLAAPDRAEWIEWLRQRRMTVHAHGVLMLHAGVVPQWDLAQTLELAAALEAALRSADLAPFLASMFGNEPSLWSEVSGEVASEAASETERLRFTLNTLTRIRFVDADGRLEFDAKDGTAPPGHVPWFDAPGRRTAGVPIAFGHWSTLGYIDRPDLLGLDTGCVWGGVLTAVRLGSDGSRERISVDCASGAAGSP